MPAQETFLNDERPLKSSRFNAGFYWGSSTSAHQTEGGNHNDWTVWEKANAERLTKEAEKKFGRFPNWEKIKEQAQNPKNYVSGLACDHYRRFAEDFDLAKNLGHNAHRFSLEWSRIEPEEGKFDEKEIAHYREVIRALRARGMEPFVTIWHWTVPLWFRDKGGWKNPEAPKYFSAFVQKVAISFPEIVFWITLNEPMVFAGASFLQGKWPPQEKNPWACFIVIENLIVAHKEAYRIIKQIRPQTKVGIAQDIVYFEPFQNKIINKILKKAADWWFNFRLLNKIRDYQDFIGLNYYKHNIVRCCPNRRKENSNLSDLGWELYPEGIYYVLKNLSFYQKPIYITENGLADAEDNNRAQFISETLENISKAISEGADVRGYLHWSLLDNFEWDKGFWPRFGLVEINYKTLERKIRPSAMIYKDLIRKYSEK